MPTASLSTVTETCRGVYPPVGGRLANFATRWRDITADSWVRQVVLSGYQIEFTAVPPRRPVKRVTRLPHDETKRQALLNEISELLLKQAIYRIPADARGGFWASFFLTKKKSGEWRPILNLKPLNAFVKPQSFRMQTLKQVLQCPIKGCWTTSLDLKDAYLHVPIHTDHQRWLRFQIGDEAYAFRCLPFGLSTAPRVFTRVVTAVAVGEHLRCRGVSLCQYLDDWLIVSGSEKEARRHTDLVVETVERLGFIINRQKSHLSPTQQPVFLGASLDLVQGRARPSPERVVSMVTCVNGLRASQVALARVWLQALGLMASMVDIVPLCRLHMRRIQLHVILHYSAAVHSLGRLIPMNREMKEALQWWTSLDHLTEGTVFPQPAPTCTVTTDASLWGWGGHLEGNQVQGQWSREESRAHVNLLELWAVSNTLRAFSSQVQGRTVRIQSDSATVVAYLNKQGGDSLPDTLPSHNTSPGVVLHEEYHSDGLPHCRREERARRQSVKGQSDRGPLSRKAIASGRPALIQKAGSSSDGPIRIQPRCSGAEVLLQVPRHGSNGGGRIQHQLERLSVVRLPSDSFDPQSGPENQGGGGRRHSSSTLLAESAVVQPHDGAPGRPSNNVTGATGPANSTIRRERSHRGNQVPQVDCVEVVRRQLQEEGFSQEAASRAAAGRRTSTCNTNTSRLRVYYEWCGKRNCNPVRAPVELVAEFLTEMFNSGLQAGTIRNYKAAIQEVHVGFSDGSSLASSDAIRQILRGMFNTRPPQRKIVPAWNLSTLLESLKGAPYEPLVAASLTNLTHKTLMLIALASGRRCSELHALSTGEHLRLSRAGATLYFRPGFLAKNERVSFSADPIFLPSIATESSVHEDRLWCPVRALRYYLKRTESIRGSVEQLFIITRVPYTAASKGLLARWICEAIENTGALNPGGAASAHSTRAMASSRAFHRGATIKEVMEAVAWKSPSTFTSTYLRDLPPAGSSFARAVLNSRLSR